MDLIDAEYTMCRNVRNIEHSTQLACDALDLEFPLDTNTPSVHILNWDCKMTIPPACTIMALIYLRVLRAADSALTKRENFTAVTLCVALMVAYKMVLCSTKTLKYFALISGIPQEELKACEILFMQARAWNVFITPAQFAGACEQLEHGEQLRMWRMEAGLTQCVQRLRLQKKQLRI
jgi:hypothetical protein